MRICTLGGVEVRCGPLFGLLCLFACLSGNLNPFLTSLAAVLLHEAAHALMAGSLGYRVESVSLTPYGCTASIPRLNGWFDELMIAIAGPVFSALTHMGCRLIGQPWAQEFARANLYIAAINLLPVYPLDGGRAARALLQLLDIRVPKPARLGLSLCASLLVAAAGWMGKNATLLVFAAFMVSSALTADRAEYSAAAAHMRRARSLAAGAPVEVRHIALWRGVSLNSAAACLGGSRYVMVWVVDEDMAVVGHVEGARIMELAANLGGDKKLGEALAALSSIDPVRH